MGEHAVCQAFCVLYKLEVSEKGEKEWKSQHRGWTQVSLYEDPADQSYRIVGWTLPEANEEKEAQIMINANVTNNCSYSKKSADFLKFVDEDLITYGFGFYKKEGVTNDHPDSPKKFYDKITSLIDRLKAELGGEDDEDSRLAFHSRTAKEGSETVKFTKLDRQSSHTLAIQTPTPNKDDHANNHITAPSSVEHMHSVQYDPATRKYTGLPKEWEGLLKQQFGLEISRLECQRVDGYKSRIPCVLVQMLNYLRKHKAWEIEGVFRKAANQEECSFIKTQLNQNTFESCDDIHCISTLIKRFFRDLPRPILDVVNMYTIVECGSVARAGEIVEKMPEPEGSVFLYLVDLGVEVVLQSEKNKMTAKNLGIVIGPNLFVPSMVDPMASLQYSQKVALFLQRAIVYRARAKGHTHIVDEQAATSNAIHKTF